MPLYDVEHICKLSDNQQDQLAEAITKIHSEQFSAPALFVNVRFTDISQQALYVAGKRKRANRIIGNVRHGPSRTQDDYNEVCSKLQAAWNKIVGSEQELRAIFILGSIVAGAEAGFPLPQAGQDQKWLKENLSEFKKLAQGGDGDFQDMMEELKSRPCFASVLS